MGLGHARLMMTAAFAALSACGGGAAPIDSSDGGATPALSAGAKLGEQIFEDKALSVSGKQSCATCHVAAYAFAADPSDEGPDHGLPVPLGGPNMDEPGFRNAPSLMYASFAPAFYFDSDGGPNGGFFRDGRAATLADQAIQPFITRFEMANPDAASVIERLKGRPYLADFTALYGAEVLNDPDTALQRMGQALAAFETESVDFHPFTSKYDYWLKGQATLTTQEQRGLALFNNPTKGNCSACHPSTRATGSHRRCSPILASTISASRATSRFRATVPRPHPPTRPSTAATASRVTTIWASAVRCATTAH